ncbi:MAG: dihydroorotate dehydrogenase-like protein, partial [Pseudomonadota bacterium]
SDYAKRIDEAGADAIELNIYYIPTDPSLSGADVENQYLEILKRVKDTVGVPVAMKLSPYFSSMANMVKRLDEAGASGFVLFNRFYQPDINPDALETEPSISFSTSTDALLPLRWIAILFGRIEASLAAMTGIHTALDVVKLVMAGADVTMMCATLLKNGIGRLSEIEREMTEWMDKHGYDSVEQMKGKMSHKSVANPAAFERANYMKALTEYK